MKTIKIRERFLKTRREISSWLDLNKIHDYIILENKETGFIVNVNSEVNLSGKKIDFLPIQFGWVERHFLCGNTGLNSLIGSPFIVGGNFDCERNNLISLKGCPKNVGLSFDSHHNCLTSLRYCPSFVGENFFCEKNNLQSLFYCPLKVGGSFYAGDNPSLGSAQKISDFSKIYEIHIAIKEKSIISAEVNKKLLPVGITIESPPLHKI